MQNGAAQAATAYAHTNIALVKYWGKRRGADPQLNLPAVGSLSLTLDRFGTETRVAPGAGAADAFTLDGAPVDAGAAEARKVFAFLDLVAGPGRARAVVTSTNHVPTAAGLASSASGFAALALAAAAAYGVQADVRALSQLARQGSGSACRSLFGGFALWHRGVRDDGADCFAEALSSSLDVRLVVVRCAVGKKSVASTKGMEQTAETSPYFRAWVETHARDLDDAVAAVAAADLERLGAVMERNTMKMHASALAADPWILYWNHASVAVLHEVRALRASGTPAWCTMDAGPHVKILCAPAVAGAVADHIRGVDGVVGIDVCAPGPAARIVA